MFLDIQEYEIKQDSSAVRILIEEEQPVLAENKEPFVNYYFYDETKALRAQGLYRGKTLSCILSQDYASIGCVKGVVQQGKWQLILISEKELPNLKCTIEYDIEIEKDQNRPISIYRAYEAYKEAWHKGDFHTHTSLSDGCLDLKEAEEALVKNGLDFIFLTDHNVVHPDLKEYQGFFGGMELTLGAGHMNLHGIKSVPFENYKDFTALLSKGQLSIEDLLDKIKALSISINHPFMKPWEYTYEEMPLEKIGAIEVVCDPTWKSAQAANDLAIRFIHFLWTKGHRIVAIGGSDSHLPYGATYEWANTPSWYGDPATFVYAKGLTEEKILSGVKMGRVYISRGPLLEMRINGGKYLPGDTLKERSITYELSSPNLKEKVCATLIINGKKKCVKRLEPSKTLIFRVKLGINYSSVSIEIRDEKDEFLAIINPIFYGRKETTYTTWKQAIDAFRLQEGVDYD